MWEKIFSHILASEMIEIAPETSNQCQENYQTLIILSQTTKEPKIFWFGRLLLLLGLQNCHQAWFYGLNLWSNGKNSKSRKYEKFVVGFLDMSFEPHRTRFLPKISGWARGTLKCEWWCYLHMSSSQKLQFFCGENFARTGARMFGVATGCHRESGRRT